MIGRIVPTAAILVSTLLLIATGGFAQTPTPQIPKYPIQVDANYFKTHIPPSPKYLALDLLSPDTKTALNREAQAALSGNANAIGAASTIVSIPRFSGSFTSGPVQPFIMVGNPPPTTGKTLIKTQLVPISLVFDGFINPQTGTTAVINTGPFVVGKTLAGPDFARTQYTDGFSLQFADAVQRAEFQSVRRTDWHTILNPPTMFAGVTLHVTSTDPSIVQVFQLPDGKIYCLFDFNFFRNQLNTLLQSEPLTPRQLRIFLIKNTFLFQGGNPANCCVVGFHTANETITSTQTFLQTYAYASWIDSDVATQFLGNPTFMDIVALSHEISEWMNDPFPGILTNAVTPPWQFPGHPGVCQGNLEVGDPVEVLAQNLITFPVTLGGFTYHPQNEALLQWFAQVTPSDAINGAYSYPNENSLTSASISCP